MEVAEAVPVSAAGDRQGPWGGSSSPRLWQPLGPGGEHTAPATPAAATSSGLPGYLQTLI